VSLLHADVYAGVQIIQLLPTQLLSRAALFPPLATEGALTPSFFDAPGAQHALTPLPGRAPRLFPAVTLMFISPAQVRRGCVVHSLPHQNHSLVNVMCLPSDKVFS
jgi:hypothetical protein